MRYIKCNNESIEIYKFKDDSSSKSSYSIKSCQIKKIKESQFNKQFVFSLKCDGEKFYFACENNDDYEKWVNFFKQHTKRPSLLCVQPKITAKNMRRLSVQTFSDKRITQNASVFPKEEIISRTNDVIKHHHQFQYELSYAELYSKFLSTILQHIEDSINDNKEIIHSLPGIKIEEIQSQKERDNILLNMKSLNIILQQSIQGIYIPFECIIDCINGHSYKAQLIINEKIKNHENLQIFSDANQSKLSLLSLILGINEITSKKIDCYEDENGNLWIINSSILFQDEQFKKDMKKENEKNIEKFVYDLENGFLFVYDSPSLLQNMKRYKISNEDIGIIYNKISSKFVKTVLINDIISRICKELFQETLKTDSSTESIVKFFNTILGNSKDCQKYFNKKIQSKISEAFKIEDIKFKDIQKELLFLSLQFHLGVDFIDSNEYNFQQENPISTSQFLCIHNIPLHFIDFYQFKCHKNFDTFSLIRTRKYEKATKHLNNQISFLQTLYGEQNYLTQNKLIQLCYSSLFNQDYETSQMCYNSLSTRQYSPGFTMSFIIKIAEQLRNKQISEMEKQINEFKSILRYYYKEYSRIENFFYLILIRLLLSYKEFEFCGKIINEIKNKVETSVGKYNLYISESILLLNKNETEKSYKLLKENETFILNVFKEESEEFSLFCYYISNLLINMNNFDEALRYAIICYEYRKRSNQYEEIFESVEQIAFIYNRQGEYQQSIHFYEALLKYLRNTNKHQKEIVFVAQIIVQQYFQIIFEQNEFFDIINDIKAQNVIDTNYQKIILQHLTEDDNINLVNIFSNFGDAENLTVLTALHRIACCKPNILLEMMNNISK